MNTIKSIVTHVVAYVLGYLTCIGMLRMYYRNESKALENLAGKVESLADSLVPEPFPIEKPDPTQIPTPYNIGHGRNPLDSDCCTRDPHSGEILYCEEHYSDQFDTFGMEEKEKEWETFEFDNYPEFGWERVSLAEESYQHAYHNGPPAYVTIQHGGEQIKRCLVLNYSVEDNTLLVTMPFEEGDPRFDDEPEVVWDHFLREARATRQYRLSDIVVRS